MGHESQSERDFALPAMPSPGSIVKYQMNRLRIFRYLIFLLAPIICCSRALSQDDLEATDKRIFQEIRAHNHLMENLEYLSDRIGPRLTGSEQLRTAEIWASDVAKQYGLENVHLEGWKIAHSWRRGSAQAKFTGNARMVEATSADQMDSSCATL
jgi:hypothetical protein